MKFEIVELRSSIFQNCEFSNVYFNHSELNFAVFNECKMMDISFSTSELYEAKLNGFTGAMDSSYCISGCDFHEVDLTKTEPFWHHGFFKEKINDILNSNYGDSTTILPEGVERPANWK